jgi:hypothetical protein
MAKKRYIVKADFLAFPDKNVHQGNEIELEATNPGTKVLLEAEAIEEIKASKKEEEK